MEGVALQAGAEDGQGGVGDGVVLWGVLGWESNGGCLWCWGGLIGGI